MKPWVALLYLEQHSMGHLSRFGQVDKLLLEGSVSVYIGKLHDCAFFSRFGKRVNGHYFITLLSSRNDHTLTAKLGKRFANLLPRG